MSAAIFAVTVLNASTDPNQHLDVKFDTRNLKLVQFTLAPNEMGTVDDVVVNLPVEDLVASQRPYGTHTWFPLEGSPIVVQMTDKMTNTRVYLGGSYGSSTRTAMTKTKYDADDIQYNEDYGDYDVTCTKCGMCFICSSESDAQSTLFQHIQEDHKPTDLK